MTARESAGDPVAVDGTAMNFVLATACPTILAGLIINGVLVTKICESREFRKRDISFLLIFVTGSDFFNSIFGPLVSLLHIFDSQNLVKYFYHIGCFYVLFRVTSAVFQATVQLNRVMRLWSSTWLARCFNRPNLIIIVPVLLGIADLVSMLPYVNEHMVEPTNHFFHLYYNHSFPLFRVTYKITTTWLTFLVSAILLTLYCHRLWKRYFVGKCCKKRQRNKHKKATVRRINGTRWAIQRKVETGHRPSASLGFSGVSLHRTMSTSLPDLGRDSVVSRLPIITSYEESSNIDATDRNLRYRKSSALRKGSVLMNAPIQVTETQVIPSTCIFKTDLEHIEEIDNDKGTEFNAIETDTALTEHEKCFKNDHKLRRSKTTSNILHGFNSPMADQSRKIDSSAKMNSKQRRTENESHQNLECEFNKTDQNAEDGSNSSSQTEHNESDILHPYGSAPAGASPDVPVEKVTNSQIATQERGCQFQNISIQCQEITNETTTCLLEIESTDKVVVDNSTDSLTVPVPADALLQEKAVEVNPHQEKVSSNETKNDHVTTHTKGLAQAKVSIHERGMDCVALQVEELANDSELLQQAKDEDDQPHRDVLTQVGRTRKEAVVGIASPVKYTSIRQRPRHRRVSAKKNIPNKKELLVNDKRYQRLTDVMGTSCEMKSFLNEGLRQRMRQRGRGRLWLSKQRSLSLGHIVVGADIAMEVNSNIPIVRKAL